MNVGSGNVTLFQSGGTFRFQVWDPELGSGASWSIKTRPKTGDVYIAHREGAKWFHSSFHDSGRSHYGLSAAARCLNPDDDPYFAVQHEPVELASGWRHAHRVTVARTELRHHQEAVSENQIVPIPIPNGFDAVMINTYLRAPNVDGALNLDLLDKVVAVMNRGDGGYALVLTRPCELSGTAAALLAPRIGEIRREFIEQGWDGQPRHTAFQELNVGGFHHEIEFVFEGL